MKPRTRTTSAGAAARMPGEMWIDLSSDANQPWQFRPIGGTTTSSATETWEPIRVPNGGYRAQGHDCDGGEYQTVLALPNFRAGAVVQICFEAVNFACDVFVGPVGSALAKVGGHVGGWLPFSIDLTQHVQPGQSYALVVHVSGRNKLRHQRTVANWEWTGEFKTSSVNQYLVPEAAPWQTKLEEGLLRGVHLRILPQMYLSEPFVVTSVSEGTIQPFVTVHNESHEPMTGTLRAKIKPADGKKRKYAKLPLIPVTLNAGQTLRFDLTTSVWGLGCESYWWPNVPYKQGYRAALHEIELELVVNNKVVHTTSQTFGFREFTWRGSSYYLNGIKCNLRGDNQTEANFGTDAYGTHPGFGPPSKSNPGWPAAVDTLQRLNFNVMRIHQVPPTRYMLDVCDQLGLMIIDETPVRGSEGVEDFVGGWDNMISTARELALRDRNHPSVIIWSAANEIWNNRPLALALQGAVWSTDWTRPVIIDGISDVGPEIINMQHYCGGLGIFPEAGADKRSDRPYGETECIWPMDNAAQGFTWMATSTRHRRLKGNADIRNYVLNNAFPNYIPGHSREQQVLEKKIKDIRWSQVTSGMEIMPDIPSPWTHPTIKLMQNCFNPCTACDLKYDQENRVSDHTGAWPSKKLTLPRSALVRRQLAIFNDTFDTPRLSFRWRTIYRKKQLQSSTLTLHVPLGEHIRLPIEFQSPTTPGELRLELAVFKDNTCVFVDDGIVFVVE